jgi:hypothetical protein
MPAKIRFWSSSAALASATVLVLALPFPAGDVPTPPHSPATRDATPTRSWTERVTRDLRRAEYQVSRLDDQGWGAPNRAHDLRSRFEPEGVELTSRTDAGAWRMRLELESLGRPGSMHPVGPAEPRASGNRVDYRRDHLGLIEWYVNDERGLEQSFRLAKRPRGKRGEPLVFQLQVSAGLRATATAGGRSIAFADVDGRAVLRYDHLAVTDARGAPLPATLAATGDRLRIEVDDRDARYPIVVDPLLSAYSWSDQGDWAGIQLGLSVATAGDVNGDGFSDIIVGAPGYDGGQINEGRVHVYLGSPTGPAIDPSWTADANASGAKLGSSVATAGDVNNDGYDDIIVGAPEYGVGGPAMEGWAFVWMGGAAGLGDNGTPGNADWHAESNVSAGLLGTSVATAGDVNGDGYDDVVIGVPQYESVAGEHEEGGVFVWLGGATGLGATGDLTNADWHAEMNVVTSFLGTAVSTAGDVNGDGYDDVVVGCRDYTAGDASGRALAWYGSNTGLGANGTPANADWVREGEVGRFVGWSVAHAGDVNGDGYADVVVGAPEDDAPTQGRVYVFHGSFLGLGAVAASTRTGVAGEHYGRTVSTAGDVNGDGFADVVVGAPTASLPEAGEGRAVVYHGGPNGIGVSPQWTGEGNQDGAHFGWSVACAGDVNGDGLGDVIVGAESFDSFAADVGAAYLFQGSTTGVQAGAAWSPDADQDFADFGLSVAAAGDVNGDGFSDVIVGAPRFDTGAGRTGKVFAYYGSETGLPVAASWTAQTAQVDAHFGHAVAGAGDVNGDGFDDVIVGAHHYSADVADAGTAFVYLGSVNGLQNVVHWREDGDQGGARLGCSVASAGDVNGDGYGDIVVGAEEYDAGQNNEGRVYVFLGSGLGPGQSAAWIEDGDHTSGLFGCAVASAGDVNRDGFSDVIVGESGYAGGEAGEGRACVYHGSAVGLAVTPAWTEERNQLFEHLGGSVAPAGDVNGDGYSDVIVGAALFDGSHQDEGRAWVFHGSAAGLAGSAAWFSDVDQDGAYMGSSVASAGDVNGDGYSDVIVGGPGYDNGNNDEGTAWVYMGSATGLQAADGWSAEGNQDLAEYGSCVAPAGDVNGDGYADVVVGAHRYDLGQTDEGRAYLYYGNGGDGLDRNFQQFRNASSTPVALLGRSDAGNSVRLRARCRTVAGRRRVGMEYEVKPLGIAFDGSGIGGTSWINSGAPQSYGSMVSRLWQVNGLTAGTVYHWRMRVVADSPFFPRGPWVSMAGNGTGEADFRTSGGPVDVPRAADASGLILQAPQPNPASGSSVIAYSLPAEGPVELAVYDTQGRLRATLFAGLQPAGSHRVTWDGRDAQGGALPAGTYFARLAFRDQVQTRKLLRVR